MATTLRPHTHPDAADESPLIACPIAVVHRELETALARHKIRMGWPGNGQVVHIASDPVFEDRLVRREPGPSAGGDPAWASMNE